MADTAATVTPREALERVKGYLESYELTVLLADGFEDAFIGLMYRFTNAPVAAYDRAKCIQILMERDGMGEDEAEEFFEFNVIGAYVGELTPCFISRFDGEDYPV